MIVGRSRGEPGTVRPQGRTVQCGLWCALPFSQAFAPQTQFAEPALSEVEGPLQGTSQLSRSGGLAFRSLSGTSKPG